ncbi:hypothetical protein [Azospirillum argentinense]|uniref:hypothetical protein n=1 Tax=Azospirillum argentinense TaxID=2970906 RepID=UPI0011AF34CA|nr:hypothetical protein [Azospirillum argentinense]
MIPDYERYHGVVIREIIVKAPSLLQIGAIGGSGRVSSFCINGKTAVHIKHCAKRLAPWRFTFTDDNRLEIGRLQSRFESVWLAFVCGVDGIVSLSISEFHDVTENRMNSARFIRIDRDRNTMYRVFGNAGKLGMAKRRGVSEIVSDAIS